MVRTDVADVEPAAFETVAEYVSLLELAPSGVTWAHGMTNVSEVAPLITMPFFFHW